ncbi:hypothetical protein [Lactococcus lactis]|uniref:Uncharacterized protein n=1 Tax=Lactococcus lactis subsp. lactis TaxID=1360 RepID=A0A0V8E881_LACLL|nr:hypothetical protein [Lactococcus lactis]KSU21832.1 hypothetical protein M20_0726 [Lactococcus lactis subsp. lactis]
MSKRDDVSRYYDSNAAVQKVVTYSFIVNIVGSVFTLFSAGTFFHFIILLQFIASFINILFSWLTNFIFFPAAERARRKTLIDNAFDLDTTIDETDDYYNNDLSPSIEKLILNAFESIYFTLNLSQKMIPREAIKSLGAIIVLIITLNVFTTNELPLIVLQVVFSSSYILGMINLILYYYRLKSLYDDFYKCLITEKTCSDITIIHLVSLCVEYEIIKGSQQIKISSKLFKELNPKLSANWDKLKTKCIYYHN